MKISKFTLIELVVAASLMMLIMSILGTAFTTVSHAMSGVTKKVDEQYGVQNAFHRVFTDLENAQVGFPVSNKSSASALFDSTDKTEGIKNITCDDTGGETVFLSYLVSNAYDGGVRGSDGSLMFSSMSIDETDRPLYFVEWVYTGKTENTKYQIPERSVYVRRYEIRNGLRKGWKASQVGPYSTGISAQGIKNDKDVFIEKVVFNIAKVDIETGEYKFKTNASANHTISANGNMSFVKIAFVGHIESDEKEEDHQYSIIVPINNIGILE